MTVRLESLLERKAERPNEQNRALRTREDVDWSLHLAGQLVNLVE